MILSDDDRPIRIRPRKLRTPRTGSPACSSALSVEETAEVMEISARTVKGDWAVARAWLPAQLVERRTS